ncbi:MAG: hypothetical protein HOI66_01785 [Verrucomicrobia bacterium]|jgi:hypothetical protein|nr:hypothetical protein [Verrucomicrobiota bacterium]
MSNWTFAASLPIVLLGLGVWLLALWLSWNNWKRQSNRPAIGFLESVRMIIVTLLIVTLLKPERVRQVERTEKPSIVVLHDGSGSMTTSDVVVSNSVVSREAWVQDALTNQFYAPLQSGAQVEIQSFAVPPTDEIDNPSGFLEGTDLSLALENVLQQFEDLKGVIVLTDGDWNQGLPPIGVATQFRDRDVPVFPVAVGRQSPLPDIAIDDVDAPAYGLLGEQISIPIRIRNDFPREIITNLGLFDGDTRLATKEVRIPAESELQESVVWDPKETGTLDLTVRIDPEAEELLADNNEESFQIGIRLETLKVLVVDSKPRWEYRYLRNALARDPGVQMNCLLFHPGLAMGGGRHYISAFPSTKEQISKYDVIFLGDVGVGPNQLKESDVELIRGLVEQQSSGLVFMPGRSGHQQSLSSGPLADLIPVILNEERPKGIGLQNESQLSLSTLGKGHWLTRFDTDRQKNDELWRQLPGFYWSAAVEKSRPGSEVLAVHSTIRNSWGRIPLLVTRPFGTGKVLFMGTDSAWRWRRGVEDKYHYRFWSQVVRWMAHQRHLSETDGIRLTYTPEVAEVGDTMYLQATILDNSGYPAQSGNVMATVTGPSGRSEKIEFALSTGGWGVFTATFNPQESGQHVITVRAEEYGRKLETDLQITRPLIEKIGQPINRQALQEIASVSRGKLSGTEGLSEIVAALQSLPEPKPREIRLRLWANPFWGGLLLLLLVIYWIGRKIVGLV